MTAGFVLTLMGWFAPPMNAFVLNVRMGGPIALLVGFVFMLCSCLMCAVNQGRCCTCCYPRKTLPASKAPVLNGPVIHRSIVAETGLDSPLVKKRQADTDRSVVVANQQTLDYPYAYPARLGGDAGDDVGFHLSDVVGDVREVGCDGTNMGRNEGLDASHAREVVGDVGTQQRTVVVANRQTLDYLYMSRVQDIGVDVGVEARFELGGDVGDSGTQQQQRTPGARCDMKNPHKTGYEARDGSAIRESDYPDDSGTGEGLRNAYNIPLNHRHPSGDTPGFYNGQASHGRADRGYQLISSDEEASLEKRLTMNCTECPHQLPCGRHRREGLHMGMPDQRTGHGTSQHMYQQTGQRINLQNNQQNSQQRDHQTGQQIDQQTGQHRNHTAQQTCLLLSQQTCQDKSSGKALRSGEAYVCSNRSQCPLTPRTSAHARTSLARSNSGRWSRMEHHIV
jgi:hypothetical protein